MSSCCPMCYKISSIDNHGICDTGSGGQPDENKIAKGKEQMRYFQVLQRYLDIDFDETGIGHVLNVNISGTEMGKKLSSPSSPIENLNGLHEIGMISCDECSNLLESVCELYAQLKKAELFLNWKVEILKNCMKQSKHREKEFLKSFRQSMMEIEKEGSRKKSNELVDSLMKWKKLLVVKCTQKLRARNPKVSITKWGSRSHKQRNSSEVSGYQIKEIETGTVDLGRPKELINANDRSSKIPGPDRITRKRKISKVNEEDNQDIYDEAGSVSESDPIEDETYEYEGSEINSSSSSLSLTSSDEDGEEEFKFIQDAASSTSNVTGSMETEEDLGPDNYDDSTDAVNAIGDQEAANDKKVGIPGEEMDSTTENKSASVQKAEEKEGTLNLPSNTTPGMDTSSDKNSEKLDPDINYDKLTLSAIMPDRSSTTYPLRLRCSHCPILCKTVTELLLHRKHSESCKASYNPSTTVNVDIISISNKQEQVISTISLSQRILTCKSCHLSLYTQGDMKAHKKLHSPAKCNFCPEEHTPTLLAIHERQHVPQRQGTTFNCPRCDFKTNLQSLYLRHYLTVHHSIILAEPKCPICNVHGSNLRFWEHIKTHHNYNVGSSKMRKCTIPKCHAYFNGTWSGQQLKDHLRLRHNLDDRECKAMLKHKCKDCDKGYDTPDKLRKHRIQHHVPIEKAIPCSYPNCTTLFETEKELARHLKYGLNSHKSLDEPNKTFVECPTCKKSVSALHPNYLRNHMKAHANDTICDICGKALSCKSQLENHIYMHHTHPDKWDYLCSVCSKKCPTKQKLEEHMRTHSQEKPFVCEVCGQKYGHRHNLRIHVKNKHGDKVQQVPKPQSSASVS